MTRPRKHRTQVYDRLYHIQVKPVTRRKLQIVSACEDIPIMDIVDLLVTQYIVERNLTEAVARLLTQSEIAEQTREAWEADLKKKWEEERKKKDADQNH